MSDWDGRPVNPERDGWHWVRDWRGHIDPQLLLWRDYEWWDPEPGQEGVVTYHRVVTRFRYIGPCLPPEVTDA